MRQVQAECGFRRVRTAANRCCFGFALCCHNTLPYRFGRQKIEMHKNMNLYILINLTGAAVSGVFCRQNIVKKLTTVGQSTHGS